MIPTKHLQAPQKTISRVDDSSVTWAVTGSLGMVLQSLRVDIHDIDIQTEGDGAYEIERRLVGYVTDPMRYLASEKMHSHFGKLQIMGVEVEVMGDIQKQLDDPG